MGKQGKQWQTTAPWKDGQQGREQQAGSHSWGYWPGSWRSRVNKDSSENKEKPALQHFPDYNQISVSTTGTGGQTQDPAMEGSDVEDPVTQGYVKHLQKLLNTARRVDARTRKLVADKEHKNAQWEAFQTALRTKFLEQRQLHGKETKALDKEMMDLAAQKQDCLRQIQAAVASGAKPQGPGEQARQQPSAEEMDAWNSFMGASPQQAGTPEDVIIRRALQAAQHPDAFLSGSLEQGQTLPSQASPPGFATPLHRGPQPAPYTPAPPSSMRQTGQGCIQLAAAIPPPSGAEGQYVASSPAISDPYIASPGTTTAACSAAMGTASVKRPGSRAPKQRGSVKDASRPTSVARSSPGDRVSLGDVLQAKRDAATRQLQQGASVAEPSQHQPPGGRRFPKGGGPQLVRDGVTPTAAAGVRTLCHAPNGRRDSGHLLYFGLVRGPTCVVDALQRYRAPAAASVVACSRMLEVYIHGTVEGCTVAPSLPLKPHEVDGFRSAAVRGFSGLAAVH